MTISQKTVYTTTGGQTFDSLAAALAHENASQIQADVANIIHFDGQPAFTPQVCADITEHATALLAIFERHINEKDWLNQAYAPQPGASFTCVDCGGTFSNMDAMLKHACGDMYALRHAPDGATVGAFALQGPWKGTPDEVAGLSVPASYGKSPALAAAYGPSKFLEAAKVMQAAAEAHERLAVEGDPVRVSPDELAGAGFAAQRAEGMEPKADEEPLRVGRLIPRPLPGRDMTPAKPTPDEMLGLVQAVEALPEEQKAALAMRVDALAGLPASDPEVKLPDYTKSHT